MMLSQLFSRRLLDVFCRPKQSRRRKSSRRRSLYEPRHEHLEPKKLLTVEYYGLYHTNTTSAEENYYYQVGVTTQGTGELWIRYNAQFDRIDFDDNRFFSNVSNFGFITPSAYSNVPLETTASGNGGFSLDALNAVKAKWNDGTTEETFTSRSVDVLAEAGTKVYLANGDPFPLGLFIGTSNVAKSRPGTFGASFRNQPITMSNGGNAGVPSLVDIRGPIDNAERALFAGHDTSFDGNYITLDATVTTGGIGFQARSFVELKNTISSYVDAYVETGDLHLTPGATINGTTGIFIGTAGGGTGRGGQGGDILIDGTINGSSVTLQTNSTTKATHIKTGTSGVIAGGGSLTVFNAGMDGGTIDLTTRNYDVTNVNVGSQGAVLPDIGISIEQTAGDLTIAAVPSSRGQITLVASGASSSINVDAGIATEGGLKLDATNLQVNSPLSTEAGNIQLVGNSVAVGSNVYAGRNGIGNVYIESRTAGVTLDSASLIQSDTGVITVDAATSISSQATLDAALLDLRAGGLITAGSNAKKLRADAGSGITITAVDSLEVELAVSDAGSVTISSLGELAIQSAATLGAGDVRLTAGTGLEVNRLRVANGDADISTSLGDVRINGDITVLDDTGNDLIVTSDAGNIIVSPSASVSVADQINWNAPAGRILTPGEVVDVVVDNAGTGYTSSPTVTIDAGGGAVALPNLTSGGVASVRIIDGGSGYVTRPAVQLVGGGGINAAAQAVVTNGVITAVRITNVGSGYTSAPQVIFSGGSGSGAVAEALIDGVLSATVTNTGTAYQVPPEVIISSGDGASTGAVSVDSQGGITAINIGSPGYDYGVPPTVVITDTSGSGSGASATATLTTGVTSYQITNTGSGYTSPPTITIPSPSGGGVPALARAAIAGPVSNILLAAGGDTYTEDVQVIISGDGSGATATATIHGSVGGDPLITNGSAFVLLEGDFDNAAVQAAAGTAVPFGDFEVTPSFGVQMSSITINAGTKTYVAMSFQGPTPALPGGRPFRGWVTLNDQGVPDGIDLSTYDPGTGYNGTEFGSPISVTGFGGSGTGTASSVAWGGVGLDSYEVTEAAWNFTGASGGTNDGLLGDLLVPLGNGAWARLDVSGEIGSVTLTNGGSGYTSSPSITFFDPLHSGAALDQASATASINGSLTSIEILAPGKGYTAGVPVPFSFSGGGGTNAAATGFTSSVLDQVTVTQSGSGYNPATTEVRFESIAGGVGGLASPISVTSLGELTAVHLATPGIDYVTPPTVTINDLSGAGSGAVVAATLTIGLITIDAPGSNYQVGDAITFTPSPTGDHATGQVQSVDGNGGVTAVTITNPGSGYTTPPTASITSGNGSAATLSAYMSVHDAFVITNPGTGYDPTQTIVELDSSGSGAKAVANLDPAGRVVSITMLSSGSGYTSQPNVRIAPYGHGATASASVSGGTIDSFTVITPGSNYAVPPNVTLTGGGGSNATATAVIGKIAEITGSRLSWTALETPIDALISQFSVVSVHLTGTGNLLLNATEGSLTVEGASTKDGSIVITAPSLTIADNITIGDYDSSRTHSITLEATAGDLDINAQVGNLLEGALTRPPLSTSVSLSAVSGTIGTTNPGGAGLVISENLAFTAQDTVALNTDVNRIVSGVVTDSRANITVSQTTGDASGVVLPLIVDALTASGGIIEVVAGGDLQVDSINAGQTGSIELYAENRIIESALDTTADIIADSVLLYATTGLIDLDTEAAHLTAAAMQSSVTINQGSVDRNNDGAIDALEIIRAFGRNDITITAQSPLKVNYTESASGAISLTTDNASFLSESFDVSLGNLAAPQSIAIEAAGAIQSFTPDFAEPAISPPTPPQPVAPAYLPTFTFEAGLPATVANAATAAALRWSEILVGDLNPVLNPATGEVIDDIEIRVQAGLLGGGDGPGDALANARPLAFRTDGSGLPYLAEVGVDLNDAANPELVGIMIHELGHALGMPDVPLFQSFISGDFFTGPNAVREYNSIYGAAANPSGVPLETGGGPGTAGAHWAEDVFGNELMTGFVNADMRLSRVTVGAFEDMGYEVDYSAADDFTPPALSNFVSALPSGLDQEPLISTPTLRITAAGSVDIVTNVNTIAGTALGDISVSELNQISLGESLVGSLFPRLSSTTGGISVTAAGRITANEVNATDSTNGSLTLTSSGSGVTLGSLLSPTVTVVASTDVLDISGKIIDTTTLDVSSAGSPITLTQNLHKVTKFRAVSETAVDPLTRGDIGLTAAGSVTLDEIRGDAVDLTAEDDFLQLSAIDADSLSVTSVNGKDIKLDAAASNIGAIKAVTNNGAGTRGDVSILSSASSLTITGIDADNVVITTAGQVVQNSAIKASRLEVASTGGLGITLDTRDNEVGTFAATSSTSGSSPTLGLIRFKDTSSGLVLDGVTGLSALIEAKQDITQTAPIVVMFEVSVTSTDGFNITLLDSGNVAAGFGAITNDGAGAVGNVSFNDSTAGLYLSAIDASVVTLGTFGPVTQIASVVANLLYVTSTSDWGINLGTYDNQIGTFRAVSDDGAARGPVSVKNTGGGGLVLGGVTADSLTVETDGAISQSGIIDVLTTLDVSSLTGQDIVLNTHANDVAIFKAMTTDNGSPATVGDIWFKNASGILDLADIIGDSVDLDVADGLTQSAGLAVTKLKVNSAADGAITLESQANSIGEFTATNFSGDVSLVNQGIVRLTGITTGQPGTANDGDVRIVAPQGILLDGDIFAEEDSVTLDASSGTISIGTAPPLPSAPRINAGLLAYYYDSNTYADPFIPVPTTDKPSILAPNGDLIINKPNEDFTFAGYQTTGDITVTVGGFVLTGALTTSGIGKTVTIVTTGNALTAPAVGNTTGDLDLQNGGFIGGETISVTVANELKSTSTASNLFDGNSADVSVAAGSLDLPVAVDMITASAPGTVTLTDANALEIGGLTGTALKIDVGGDLTQSGALVGTSLEASSTGGVVTLTDAGNDVNSLQVTNTGRNISFTDSDGLDIVSLDGKDAVLVVGDALTQSSAIKADSLTVTATAGAVTLTNTNNEITNVSVTNTGRDISLRDQDAISITRLDGAVMSVTAGNELTQTGAITGTSLSATASTGDILLQDLGNDVVSFSATASDPTKSVSFRDANDVKIGPITADAVTLSVGSVSQQLGAIAATTLTANGSTGAIVFDDFSNAVGTISITNAGHDVTYYDTDGVSIASLTGNNINLVAGPITQTGAITATTLSVTGITGAILLDNSSNEVGGLSIINGNEAVTFVDQSGVDILSLSGGVLALQIAGDLTQSGAITGTSLSVTASAGTVDLNHASNDVDTLSIVNSGREVSFRDQDGVSVTGLTGSVLSIDVGGDLTQTGAITSTSLAVAASTGSVVLTNSGNDVASITMSNPGRAVSFTDQTGLALGAFTAGATTLTVGGALTQTAPLTASDLLTVNSTGGAVTLTQSNDLVEIDIDGTADISVTDTADLAITNLQGTALTVTTVTPGNITQTAGGTIISTSLMLTVADGIANLSGNNDVDSLDAELLGTSAGRALTFNDIDDLVITQINEGGAITLNVGGALTQTGTITGGSLIITSTAGSVTLGLNNEVDDLAITTNNGSVTYIDIDDVEIVSPGIDAGTAAINLRAGSFTQSADIKGDSLTVMGTTGAVDLGRATNDVNAVTISNSNRAVIFADTDDLTVMGITGGAINLVTGTVNQTGATGIISGSTLDVTGTVGPISLDRQNTVTSFKASNGSRPITFTDANALELDDVTGGAITVTVNGSLTQSAATSVQGTSLTVNSASGDVVLENAGNSVASLAVTNGSRAIKYKNATNLTSVALLGGDVELTALGIIDSDASPDVTATTAKLIATGGTISLGLAVDTVTATATGNIGLTNTKALGLTASSSGSSVTASAAGSLTATSVVATGNVNLTATGATSDITVGAITANAATGTTTLTAGRSITDADALVDITAHAAALTATAGSIDIDLAVNSASASAATNINILNTKALGLTATSSGGNVVASAVGTLSATSVSAAAGNVTLTATGATSDIAVGVITASAGTGTATLAAGRSITDADVAADVTANAATLTATDGSINLDLAVNTANATAKTGVDLSNTKTLGLAATSTTGNVVATTAAGTLTATSVSAAAGNVNLTATGAASDIVVGGITASPTIGTATLQAGRSITDGDTAADITANSAGLTATAGSIDVDLAVNTVSKARANGGINISNTKALGLSDTTSTTGNVVATAAGTLTATSVSAAAGSVSLTATNAGNIAVGVVTANSATGIATFVAAGSITDGDTATNVTAKSAALTASTGTIDIDTSVDTLTATAAGNIDVSNTKALGLTATSTTGTLAASSIGDMTIGQGTIQGMVTLTTTSGGSLYVSSITNGVLSSQTEIDLRGIAGSVILINNGKIVTPSVQLKSGVAIDVGEPATTPGALTAAIDRINNTDDLPDLGVPYQIIVGADVSLASPLTVNRPVNLRGIPSGTVVAGQISGSGLTLTSGASGSRISDLTFSNYTGTALRLNGVKNAEIHNNIFLNANIGLLVTGASDGTTVRNNVFRQMGTGISLNDATSLSVGGTQPGQPNRIENAAVAGVFATGENQFSEVVYTQFANNRLNYDIDEARGLTLIDGVVPPQNTPIESFGGVTLARDDNHNLFAGSAPIRYRGNQITTTQFPGYSAIAAEDFGANGGKQVLFEHTSGNYFLWTTDSSWNYSSGGTIRGTSVTSVLQQFGLQSATETVELEAIGSTSLNQDGVGLLSASGQPILFGGKQIADGQFNGFTAVAAEDFGANDGKQVLFRHSSGDFFLWSTNANWEYQSGNWVRGNAAVPTLEQFGLRTTVHAGGSASLNKDAAGRLFAGLTPILFGGKQIADGQFNGYSAVAAEDFGANGGKQVLFRHSSGDYFLWNTNANWEYQSGSWVRGNAAMPTLEQFGLLTIIHTGGQTTLSQDSDGRLFAGTKPILYLGSPIRAGQFVGFEAIAAEDFGANGGRQVLFRHASTGRYYVWNTDANWGYESGFWVSQGSATVNILTSFSVS